MSNVGRVRISIVVGHVVGHSQLICHALLVKSSVYYVIAAATVEKYLR